MTSKQFDALKSHVIKLFNAQKTQVQNELNEAKKLIESGDDKEGGFKLLGHIGVCPRTRP